MAEVTLSPIPYNGGTLNTAYKGHICKLDSTRFFTIYSQITPYYTFGMVSTISNIKTASPTVTNVRTQVIPELALTTTNHGVRLFTLTSEKVLAVWNDASGHWARVINIDPVTNVMTCPGAALQLSTNTGSTGYIGSIQFANGAGLAVSSDTVLVGLHTSLTNYSVFRLSISGSTITSTTSVSRTLSGTSVQSYLTLDQVPDTTNWVASIANLTTDAGFNTNPVVTRYYGDPTTTTAWATIGTTTTISNRNYIPLTNTTGYIIGGSSNEMFYENDLVFSTSVQFAADGATTDRVIWSKRVGPKTAIMAFVQNPTNVSYNASSNAGLATYFRVLSWADSTFAECSTSTKTVATISGTATPNFFLKAYPNSNGNGFEFYDANTILLYGAFSTTNTQFRISVLVAPE